MTLDEADRQAARACYLAAADRCLEEGAELDAMLLGSDASYLLSRVRHTQQTRQAARAARERVA